MDEFDREAEIPEAGEPSLEGRVKALEALVLLLLRDLAKDERKAHNLLSGLRHLGRDLQARDREADQLRYLAEARASLLARLAARFRDEPFD